MDREVYHHSVSARSEFSYMWESRVRCWNVTCVSGQEGEVNSKSNSIRSLLTVVWQSYKGGGNAWRSCVQSIPQVCHNRDVECVFHEGLQILEGIAVFCAWSDDLSLHMFIPWWKKTSRGLQWVRSLVLQWEMFKPHAWKRKLMYLLDVA